MVVRYDSPGSLCQTRPTVRVMISCRRKPRFPYKGSADAQPSDIRRDLAAMIETEVLFGDPLFEARISETAPAASAGPQGAFQPPHRSVLRLRCESTIPRSQWWRSARGSSAFQGRVSR